MDLIIQSATLIILCFLYRFFHCKCTTPCRSTDQL